MNYNFLFCPLCYSGLLIESAHEERPESLVCSGCSARYEITESGLPVFIDSSSFSADLKDESNFGNKVSESGLFNRDRAVYEKYHDQEIENIDFDSMPDDKLKSLFGTMDIKDGETILDLCCGKGKLSHRLSNYNKKINLILVDFSLNALEKIDYSNFGIGLESIALCCADALNLPLAEESVGRVVIANTMHCWTDRRLRLAVLFQAFRVLKKGGRIDILFVHNRWPKVFSPGCYLSLKKLKSHVFGNADMYCPLYPFELEAELLTLFHELNSRPSVNASTGGIFSVLDNMDFYENSLFRLLSKDSFDISAVKPVS